AGDCRRCSPQDHASRVDRLMIGIAARQGPFAGCHRRQTPAQVVYSQYKRIFKMDVSKLKCLSIE
ncbi:MAG: hypothetical protein V4603_13505, partial [Pseudomonadota bacterium]